MRARAARALTWLSGYSADMLLRRIFPQIYEGWLVVGSFALVIVMIGTAFFYGFGTIFTPIVKEFGWSNASTALAFSLRSEVGGIAAPFVGFLIDRFGPRRSLAFSSIGSGHAARCSRA